MMPAPADDSGDDSGGDAVRATRLPSPPVDACRRAEQARWLRRRLLERQLHDGASLRISALSLQLGLFRHRVPATEEELRAAVGGLQDELHAVLQELREVARQIYPPLLDEAGLGPALREMAARLPAPVRVDTTGERFGPAAEGAAYFAVAECLNALDGDAPAVELMIRREGRGLAVHLRGIDARHAPLLHDQVRRMGGTIDVAGGPDAATITARIPCE